MRAAPPASETGPRVEIAHGHHERHCTRVLEPPLELPAACARDLDHLHAAAGHGRRSRDCPANPRVRQAEHIAERRVLRGVAGSALHLEADCAVERDRAVEVLDDRAEVVAGAENEACGLGACRRLRLQGESDEREKRGRERSRGTHGGDSIVSLVPQHAPLSAARVAHRHDSGLPGAATRIDLASYRTISRLRNLSQKSLKPSGIERRLPVEDAKQHHIARPERHGQSSTA
jgi:hypothetical protein